MYRIHRQLYRAMKVRFHNEYRRIEQMCDARDFCFEMMKNFDNGSDERAYMNIAVYAIDEAISTYENEQ